ncbi:MAG: hypothetical protein FJ071_00870 [Cyanobacteria bacterium M_DeepCast_200m_mx_001]|nr:hypothetical protein [Cyanobacteria bacterium M_DeepCast_200m_mx_001]
MSALELQPLLLQLERGPGPLTPQVLAALAAHGRPLRWAITAAERRPQGGARLQIEAVILRSGGQP